MFARSATRAWQPLKFQARRYATEGAPTPQKGGNGLVLALGGVAVGGAGYYFLGGGWAFKQADIKDAAKAAASGAQKKAFTGGDQGFMSLKLADIETVNHNTKKFRFELPEEDMVSGLVIASAILTKYQGPEMEKPVLRPYTPISSEGKLQSRT